MNGTKEKKSQINLALNPNNSKAAQEKVERAVSFTHILPPNDDCFVINKINGQQVAPKVGIMRKLYGWDAPLLEQFHNRIYKDLQSGDKWVAWGSEKGKQLVFSLKNNDHYGAIWDGRIIAEVVLDYYSPSLEFLAEVTNSQGINAEISCAVLPEYRGNGLQNILTGFAEKDPMKKVKIDAILSQIHRATLISNQNMIKLGYDAKGNDPDWDYLRKELRTSNQISLFPESLKPDKTNEKI